MSLREDSGELSVQACRDLKGELDCQCVLDEIEKHFQEMFYWNRFKKMLRAEQREAICKKLKEKVTVRYEYKRNYVFIIEQKDFIANEDVLGSASYSVAGSFTIDNNKLKISASWSAEAKNSPGQIHFNLTASLIKNGLVVESKGLDPSIRADELNPGRTSIGAAYFELDPANKLNNYKIYIKTGYQYEHYTGNPWSAVATKTIPIEVIEFR